jgi:hypothetical protein
MSVSILGRVFYTPYQGLTYQEKNGRTVTIAEVSAKATMLAIADSSDDFGENSYNSFETLATKTGLERRSVIRVVRALIAQGYIEFTGMSVYGTNTFKILQDKLGLLPERRARVGRPKSEKVKTGDSVTKTGDSVTKTGDSESPDPSLSVLDPKDGAQPAPTLLPLDWQVATGQEQVYVPSESDTFLADCDIAVMNVCRGAVNLEPLVHEFITVRRIFPQKKQFSGWRTAFQEMYGAKPNRVYPQHICEAILQLTGANMTVSDPHSVVRTAISLANPMAEAKLPGLVDVAI